RGCEKFPDTIEISKYLQSLYGAGLYTNIKRKGEDQIISFAVNAVSDKYLDDDECTLKAILLLYDLLLNPLTEDGGFKKDYVEQEKINLKNDISAIINDKRSYSAWRILELMCKDNRYGIHELGTPQDVDRITNVTLYNHYKKILSESPIDIFITGDVDIKKVISCTKEAFINIAPSSASYPVCDMYVKKEKTEDVTEKFDVTQAKLCLGYATNTMPQDDDYPALMVYNGILGGGAHSKLFNNVREKLSLAYYVSSRLERYKGIMTICSGIEIENKQKAIDEINVQLEAMRNGDISDYEFNSTIKSITNSLKAFGDDIGYSADYYLGQIVTGKNVTINELIDKIEAVTIHDVVKVAGKIEPQMIYFLTAESEANN
ncbi:MAG: insulinase family protein, partial [Ruminococcaceae bacterium]|nr:insulinase family protein [Oscillospiraceae bacterium]